MWSIRIYPEGHQQPLVLLYTNELHAIEVMDKWNAAQEAAMEPIMGGCDDDPPRVVGWKTVRVELNDDFGTVMVLPVPRGPIPVVFEDVRRGLEGGVKRAVMQAEAQTKAQQQAARAAVPGIVPAAGMGRLS